ncbi:MAG: DUF59 domain-containing protein [Alphaproteobacteria bacterium]|nr:DUF59 domain-containing protein [Alphaproteobacteria bacterium]
MTEELQAPTPIELNYTAKAGTPLPKGAKRASHEDIIGALKSVQDPELMLNVFDLGLVYNVDQKENGDVDVLMTLTSPTCPMGDEMIQMAAQAVSSVVGVGVVTVNLTFDPPWTTDMLSEEIKLMMGI